MKDAKNETRAVQRGAEKMRAVIISGGVISDYAYIRSQIRADDTIICADSGFDHAVKMGVVPAAITGDFDSVRAKLPPEIECVKFPARKNQTDTEIAVEYARQRGFADFLLLGATGGRLDHALTNILLLKKFAERGEDAEIIDEYSKITIISADVIENPAQAENALKGAGEVRPPLPAIFRLAFSVLKVVRDTRIFRRVFRRRSRGVTLAIYEPPGTIVSLVPLEHCTGVTADGFEYPLHDADLHVGEGLGVSNVVRRDVTDVPTVGLTRGVLLVIVARDVTTP